MTLFVDTFDGTDGQLVSARTGWGTTPGYVDVLKINGSGAVRNDAYVEDPKSVIHDTGALDHYIKVVIGAGYISSQGKISLGVSQTGRAPKFICSYFASTTTLQIRGLRGGSYQTLTSLTITLAAGDEIYIEQNDTAKTLVIKRNGETVFAEPNTSYYNDPAYSGVGFVLDYSGLAATDDIIRSFEANTLGGDVTAPTLTSATATATSATTATGGVTTDEAGPAWAVLTTSSTTPSAAQIKAGQNHTGAAASASDTATLTVGVNSSVFAFTGLTAGQTYWEHVVQDDTATPANTSTPITSASSITTPAPDTTNPTWPGGTTLGATAKTDTTVTLTASADATDNVGVTGYEWSSDDGASYPFTSLTKTFQFTALTALTSYPFKSRAYDAAGNKSAPIALTTSTYRAGDTAANIIANTGPVGGNPAGFLHAFASTVSSTDWLSYTIVSGPTPAGGSLDANAMGAFSYTGPAPATMVIQPEVNGANAPETITVTLYDNSVSLGAASMASTPVYGVGSVSQAAPVPLTGTAVAVASAYGSGQIAQGAPVVLAGAAFAVIPAMGAGGLMQGVPVALSADSFVVIPVFSAGALSQAAPVALMGAALSVSTAYGPGVISDAPTFTSMAPSPVCATYRRDSYPAHTFHKLAGETLDFDIDFRYELRSTQDSARIHDPVEIQAGQGVEVLGAYWVPGLRRVKMWIAGGEAQGKSDISIWLNTEAGRRLQVDVRVQIN